MDPTHRGTSGKAGGLSPEKLRYGQACLDGASPQCGVHVIV